MNEMKITIFVAVDSSGKWAAMGLSDHDPKTPKDVHAMMHEWCLTEDIFFAKIFKVTADIEPPTMEQMKLVHARAEVDDYGIEI